MQLKKIKIKFPPTRNTQKQTTKNKKTKTTTKNKNKICFFAGYGFVDFEQPAFAECAVKGLQGKGVQAQMAKVGIWVLHRPAIVRLFACK